MSRRKSDTSDMILEKALISGLTELRDTLAQGVPPEERFTMRTVDLNLDPRTYTPEDVQETRKLLGASQAVFAELIGVNVKTVQSWEQGMEPSRTARRLMDLINEDREAWLDILRSSLKEVKEAEPEVNGATA